MQHKVNGLRYLSSCRGSFKDWQKYSRWRRKNRNCLTRYPPSKETPHEDVSNEIKICMFAILRTTHLVSGIIPHKSTSVVWPTFVCTWQFPLSVSLSLSVCLSVATVCVIHFICTVSSSLPIKAIGIIKFTTVTAQMWRVSCLFGPED